MQLLNMLQQVYHVKLDDYMMPEKQALPRTGLLPLVLLSAQKFFICLGDLARYKEQLFPNTQSSSTSSHFTEAKESVFIYESRETLLCNGRTLCANELLSPPTLSEDALFIRLQ